MDILQAALVVSPLSALFALSYGAYAGRRVLRQECGTLKMTSISDAIKEGAFAYLKTQFKAILLFVFLIALALAFFLSAGVALAFLLGAFFSSLAGTVGMWIAVNSNARTAQAARRSLGAALDTAFGAGTVHAMLIVGLGLLGICIILAAANFFFASLGEKAVMEKAAEVLVGFGFGATLLALFMRVGGGIYTKAADVGADLVGKVERRIPEDDPRNPAVIADNVGDNVGDCAGMGADVFESYCVTIVAAMVLGIAAGGVQGAAFPLLLVSAAIFSAVIATATVRTEGDDPMVPLKRAFLLSNAISTILFFLLAFFVLGNLNAFGAAFTGILATQLILSVTDYYTSTRRSPVREIAESAKTGAGTNIITGIAVGFESAFAAALIVAAAIYAGYYFMGFYGIALAGLGMLAATGIIMAMDTYGPVADNAGGIGKMSGLEPRAMRAMARLDAVGNTTKALTKGFAISAAALAAVALFTTFFEKTGLAQINVASPGVFAGLLFGAAVPFLFSSMAMKAVGRAAFLIVEESRRQFRTVEGLMSGKAKPDYARCVNISTQAALNELVLPAAIIISAPLLIGFLLGVEPLGAFLAGAIVVAQLLAVFMCNGGAAWDNAKKFIEDGAFGGKGTQTHAAAVVGDTVGDPLKDTAGPALNPVIKLLNIVSLLIAGLVVANSMKLI